MLSGGDVDELVTLWRDAFGLDALSIGQGFGFAATARVVDVPEAWIGTHRRLVHLDPSAEYLRRSPRDVFHVAEHHVPGELMSAFSGKWSDAMIGILHSPFGQPIYYALYRKDGLFDADEVEALRFLQPSFERALAAWSALVAIESPPDESTERALGRLVTHARVELPQGTFTWAPRAVEALSAVAETTLTTAAVRRIERALLAILRAGGGRSHRFAFGLRAETVWLPRVSRNEQRALVLLLDDPQPAVDADAPLLAMLSARQRTVALATAQGASSREIAARLGVTPETVRTHLRSVYRALGVRTRLELANLLAPR